MLCCEAAQKKKPGLIDALMRSDERLSREDRAHIADFYAGKFSNPSGRPENPRRQWELARLADMVKELKQVAREKGVKLKHDDAIEHVVTSWGGPDEYDTLKNYIRRSKQTKKVAR
jgi:hypothetical protein